MSWLRAPCQRPCEASALAARRRQERLTKPAGSLGALEELATRFAGWQRNPLPELREIRIRVFAGDHGIARRGVSAYPRETTARMIGNFLAGGAAVSVLARAIGADFAVANMGTARPVPDAPRLRQYQLLPGTADFSRGPAMPLRVAALALAAGRDQAEGGSFQLFIGGDMGIGNSSSAAAITAALTGRPVPEVAGRGTGIDEAAWRRKCGLIARALDGHRERLDAPLALLAALGGLEIAALAGAFLRCAQRGIPVLLDGFIATAAALLACEFNPALRGWLLAGHQSAEPGHPVALRRLGLTPLLRLGMRLGEGSGAALAVPLVRAALRLHREMATFAEAGMG